MSSKKNTTAPTNLPALKIGSRVRCTDDGVTGRITWANGVSVKIKWDDGERVTWKRDSLAGRPIEILEVDEETRDAQPAAGSIAEQVAQPAPASEQVTPAEQPAPEAETAPKQASVTEPQPTDATVPEQVAETPATEPAPPAPEQTENPMGGLAIDTPATSAASKPKRQRKAKTPTGPKEKKVSALDAAALVLSETGQALTTQEMIGAMAVKGYWSSPGGKTPAATLYSAILREIDTKGEQARFVKAAPGRFALRGVVSSPGADGEPGRNGT